MRLSACTDPELVALVAAGDEAALRELLERHSAWLLLRLRRRCADAEVAASALQDTFVAVWRQAGRYRGDGPVGAWLWGIAVHQLLSRLRARSAPAPVSQQVIAALSPTVRSAEDELLLALEHSDLGSALARLNPELRQALQSTVLDGLSTREAAQLLGLPHGTVKSRVRLAKAQLRSHLLEGTT